MGKSTKAQIEDLAKQGLSKAQIATKLGLKYSEVYYVLSYKPITVAAMNRVEAVQESVIANADQVEQFFTDAIILPDESANETADEPADEFGDLILPNHKAQRSTLPMLTICKNGKFYATSVCSGIIYAGTVAARVNASGTKILLEENDKGVKITQKSGGFSGAFLQLARQISATGIAMPARYIVRRDGERIVGELQI